MCRYAPIAPCERINSKIFHSFNIPLSVISSSTTIIVPFKMKSLG